MQDKSNVTKTLELDEEYKYLEPLWQEWIVQIGKIVPADNEYYNLTHGITEEEVKNYSYLKGTMDIPDELLNFYKIHNVEYNAVTSAFNFSVNGWEYDLLPFGHIAREWQGIQNLQFGDELEECNLEEFSPKVKADDYANPRWIPFADGRNGDYLLYDTDPSAEGKYGQIIELQNESWERNVVADSLAELLQNEINAIKNGNVKKFDFLLEKDEDEESEATLKWTSFREVKHLFPQKTWAYGRNEENDGEFEDETILLVEGDLEIDNLDLDAPITAFEDRFDDYETYLKQESCFTILIKGSLRAKNIFNYNTDGATGLIVLGDVEADNIVVGGQEIYVTGDLAVKELFWGDYNHGDLSVEGKVSAKVFMATEQYHYPSDMDKDGIEVLLDDENDDEVSVEIAEIYFDDEYLDFDAEDCYGWGEIVQRKSVIEALAGGKDILKESFDEEEIDIPRIFDEIRMDSDEDMFFESKNFDTLFEKVILATKETHQVLEENGWKSNFYTAYDDEIDWMITAVRDDMLTLSIVCGAVEEKKFLGLVKKQVGKQLIVYFIPQDEEDARRLFHDELSAKFLPDIKEYWSSLLSSAQKGLSYKNLFDQSIKPQDILDITSLPLITEKYNDWDDDDKHGDWFGSRVYSFRMNGFDDSAATFRIGAEIAGDEFDARFYYFKNNDIENPDKTILGYWSSQENRTGDYYSQTNRDVCVADWRKYKEALEWYKSALPKVEKANAEFLKDKEAQKLRKEQRPMRAAKAQKPFESVEIAGVKFKVLNRNEAFAFLGDVKDFDDNEIYDVYEMHSTDGDDESMQNSFFLLCEDEATMGYLNLDTGIDGVDIDKFYILGYIFAQKIKVEQCIEAYDLDFSPPLICLADAEIANAILCGTTHYFGANLKAGTFWGEYNHGEAYIKGEMYAKLIIADDFRMYIGKLKSIDAMVCDEMRVYAHDTINYDDGAKEILSEQWSTHGIEECILPQFVYASERGYAIKDKGYRSGENHYKDGEISFDEFLREGGDSVDYEKIERLKTEFADTFEEKIHNTFETHPNLSPLPVGKSYQINKYEDHPYRYYYFIKGNDYLQIGYWNLWSHMVAFGYIIKNDVPQTVLEYYDDDNKTRRYTFATAISDNYICSLVCQRIFREALSRLNESK